MVVLQFVRMKQDDIVETEPLIAEKNVMMGITQMETGVLRPVRTKTEIEIETETEITDDDEVEDRDNLRASKHRSVETESETIPNSVTMETERMVMDVMIDADSKTTKTMITTMTNKKHKKQLQKSFTRLKLQSKQSKLHVDMMT